MVLAPHKFSTRKEPTARRGRFIPIARSPEVAKLGGAYCAITLPFCNITAVASSRSCCACRSQGRGRGGTWQCRGRSGVAMTAVARAE